MASANARTNFTEKHYRKISQELSRNEDQDDDRHARIANDFGLLGFGVHAELCRHPYAVPPDPAPAGPGGFADRVVRGGAGATHLWQNPGERKAMLTAFRQRAGGLLDSIGMRPVRSVG